VTRVGLVQYIPQREIRGTKAIAEMLRENPAGICGLRSVIPLFFFVHGKVNSHAYVAS